MSFSVNPALPIRLHQPDVALKMRPYPRHGNHVFVPPTRRKEAHVFSACICRVPQSGISCATRESEKKIVLLNSAAYFQTWRWTFQDPWSRFFEILLKMRSWDRLSTLRPWLEVEGIFFCMGRFLIRVHCKKEKPTHKNHEIACLEFDDFRSLFICFVIKTTLHTRCLPPPPLRPY